MQTKYNIEGYWTDWAAKLIPWLLTHGIRLLLIIVAAYVLNIILGWLITRMVRWSVTIDKHQTAIAEQKREETLIQIFTWSVRVFFIILVFVLILNEIGLPIGPMIAGAGILGLAV